LGVALHALHIDLLGALLSVGWIGLKSLFECRSPSRSPSNRRAAPPAGPGIHFIKFARGGGRAAIVPF
jgi:hypothetical protein